MFPERSKCWPFVTEDGVSKDTLRFKLCVRVFKCWDWFHDSNNTFKFAILDPTETLDATRLENIEPSLVALNIHLPHNTI